MRKYVPMPLTSLGKSGLAIAMSGAVLLAGCATYAPAPVTVGTVGAYSVHRPDLPPGNDVPGLLRLALDHDPAVAAARATLASAMAAQKAARNLPPLTLSLTAEYSKDSDPQKPWLYGGAVGIPLDIGAKRKARNTSADLAVVKARYALGEAVWASRQRLMQSISDLSLARDEITAAQTLVEQRMAFQAHMEKRVTHGEDANGLVAQAGLDVSAARQVLAQAQNRRLQAMAALARALDADPADVEGLELLPQPLTPLDTAQIETMVETSLYVRSDVLLAVADYDLAENDLRLAVAAQYPDITIQPGYTWERGVVKIPLALNLTLPPLDGNRAAIDAAQSARVATGKTLEDRVKTARATALQAASTYEVDAATADTIRRTDLPTSRDMAARTERMKNAGEIDQTENLLAQIDATQTELNLIQAERTARNDRLTLEDALHLAFDPAETQILTDVMTKTAEEARP